MNRNIIVSFCVATAGVLFLAAEVAAHELVVPERVYADAAGYFESPASFVIGPGPERLDYIQLLGLGNLDPSGVAYSYLCFTLLEEGTVENVSLDAFLVDPHQPAILWTSVQTCGVSGDQTYFEGFTTIVPHEPRRPGSVYWTDTGGVYRAGLDGSEPQQVVAPDEAMALDSIAIDPLEGQVYWNSWEPTLIAGVIRRARIHEGDPEIFLIGTKGGLGGIAADTADRRLYVAEPSDCVPGCGAIGRIKFDQTADEELIVLDIPDSLAVSPELGRMCWADSWNDTIECADLDGGNPSVLLSGLVAHGLAFDGAEGVLYWSQSSPPAIRRADLDAGIPEDVATEGLSDPRGVAFDPVFRRVYWADRNTGKIQRADPLGILVEDIVVDLTAPQAVALDWGHGDLRLGVDGDTLSWEAIPVAVRFDVVRGNLTALRASGGDYSVAGISCVADGVAGTSAAFGDVPGPGEGIFLIVRPVSGTGNGTHDSLGIRQIGGRDAGIGASGGDCP